MFDYEYRELHRFVSALLEQRGARITEKTPDWFAVSLAGGGEGRYTYTPAAADEAQGIYLLAPGSRALKALFEQCSRLGTGMQLQAPFQPGYAKGLVAAFFRSRQAPCPADPLYGEPGPAICTPLCPRRDLCHHHVAGGKVKAISLGPAERRLLWQFTFRIEAGNSLRRLTEVVSLAVDDSGQIVPPIDPNRLQPVDGAAPDLTAYETALEQARAWLEGQVLPVRAALVEQQSRRRLTERLQALAYQRQLEEREAVADQETGAKPARRRREPNPRQQLEQQYAIDVHVTLLNGAWLAVEEAEATVAFTGGATATVRVRPAWDQVDQPQCPGCGKPFHTGRVTADGRYTCPDCHLACAECGYTASLASDAAFVRCAACGAALCRSCAPKGRLCAGCSGAGRTQPGLAAADRQFLMQAAQWRRLADGLVEEGRRHSRVEPGRLKLRELTPLLIDRLPPNLLEEWAHLFWEGSGRRVRTLNQRGDTGLDLAVTPLAGSGQPADTGMLVALRRSVKPAKIGLRAVQEAAALREQHGLETALLATTSYFSHAALAEAERLRVTLWDRDELGRRLAEPAPQAPTFLRASQRFTQIMLLADALVEQPGDRLKLREKVEVEFDGPQGYVRGREAGRLWSIRPEHSGLVKEVIERGGQCRIRVRRTRGGDVWLDARLEWVQAQVL